MLADTEQRYPQCPVCRSVGKLGVGQFELGDLIVGPDSVPADTRVAFDFGAVPSGNDGQGPVKHHLALGSRSRNGKSAGEILEGLQSLVGWQEFRRGTLYHIHPQTSVWVARRDGEPLTFVSGFRIEDGGVVLGTSEKLWGRWLG